MMKLSPIAFFAYNRPFHTCRSLESLFNAELADRSSLYIFCDGPKNSEDEENVKQVRNIVKSKKWCKHVQVIERKHNTGLAKSIISGIDCLIKKHGRIIVIEDDLILSPKFLTFLNRALDKYSEFPEIMHVSGYFWPLKGNIPDAFFLKNISSWGWGTWKRAWKHFNVNAERLVGKVEKHKKDFNLDDSRPFYGMLKKQALKIGPESWAIRWYASIFIKGGLTLFPGESYVRNIGMDGSGTNCDSSVLYDTVLCERSVVLPDEIMENRNVKKKLISHFRRINRSRGRITFFRR